MLPSFPGGCASAPSSATFCIAGIPFDLGVTNRSGTREAPHAARRASRMLADGANPAGWTDPRDLTVADMAGFSLAAASILWQYLPLPNPGKL